MPLHAGMWASCSNSWRTAQIGLSGTIPFVVREPLVAHRWQGVRAGGAQDQPDDGDDHYSHSRSGCGPPHLHVLAIGRSVTGKQSHLPAIGLLRRQDRREIIGANGASSLFARRDSNRVGDGMPPRACENRSVLRRDVERRHSSGVRERPDYRRSRTSKPGHAIGLAAQSVGRRRIAVGGGRIPSRRTA
jgi:hypothetical protein